MLQSTWVGSGSHSASDVPQFLVSYGFSSVSACVVPNLDPGPQYTWRRGFNLFPCANVLTWNWTERGVLFWETHMFLGLYMNILNRTSNRVLYAGCFAYSKLLDGANHYYIWSCLFILLVRRRSLGYWDKILAIWLLLVHQTPPGGVPLFLSI